MQALFLGDLFATPGVRASVAYLKAEAHRYDAVIVNGENASGGHGISRKQFERLRAVGADVVTLGNHGFDNPDAVGLLEESPRLVRAINYPAGTPGVGHTTIETRDGGRLTVVQAMGRVFMDPLDDPFAALDALLETLPAEVPVLVDFHAEATSEKKVMGYHLAGRVAAVLGTHTHVQTADETLMRGTAYITDVGMTGVQDSSIGMAYEEVHYRFTTKLRRRYRPAEGPATVCGVALTFEGPRATAIERIRWRAPSD